MERKPPAVSGRSLSQTVQERVGEKRKDEEEKTGDEWVADTPSTSRKITLDGSSASASHKLSCRVARGS